MSPNGRINLGLNGITYFNQIMPFLNQWKASAGIQIIATTGPAGAQENWLSSTPPGNANSPWGVYIDAVGELINPLPATFAFLNRIFYGGTAPTELNPGINFRPGQVWVLKFDGTATTVSFGAMTGAVRVGNRITGTWPANAGNMSVSFSGVNLNDPPRNIRIVPLVYETLLDGGEIFSPDWLTEVERASGTMRFMDMMLTNNNRSTLLFSGIPTESYFSWAGGNTSETARPGIKGGVPVSVISSLANRVLSHPWINIPAVLGTSKIATVTAVTQANPAVVTAKGHSFVNSESIIMFHIDGMTTQLNKNTFTVANSDTVAGTFELSGVDSSAFPAFSNIFGGVTTPFNLSGMTTEVGLLASHFRDNLDVGRIAHFEFGNEDWNSLFDVFHWLAAIGKVKYSSNIPKMAGYLAAHCMKTIRDTYGVNNRSKWKGILGSQTGNIAVTPDLLIGVNDYISENAPGLAVSDLFDYLAITGYYGESHSVNQASKACTMALGSPGVCTSNNHAYENNRPIKFTTTGSLLTPLDTTTMFFVVNKTTNTFQVALTAGGAALAFTGSQSGTHTVAHVREDWWRGVMDDSATRFTNGLEATKYSYYDRVWNQEMTDGSLAGNTFAVTKLPAFWQAHKDLIDTLGLKLIQYEGGYAIAFTAFANDAQVKEFVPKSTHTALAAETFRLEWQEFLDMGGVYPAKYVDATPVSQFGAYGGLRWIGDSNPVWDAAVEFNDPTPPPPVPEYTGPLRGGINFASAFKAAMPRYIA